MPMDYITFVNLPGNVRYSTVRILHTGTCFPPAQVRISFACRASFKLHGLGVVQLSSSSNPLRGKRSNTVCSSLVGDLQYSTYRQIPSQGGEEENRGGFGSLVSAAPRTQLPHCDGNNFEYFNISSGSGCKNNAQELPSKLQRDQATTCETTLSLSFSDV